jgi:hypothetical protein
MRPSAFSRPTRIVQSLLLVLLVPQIAAAFGFQDKPTRWPRGKSIEFTINMAGVPANLPQERYVESLKKALDAWRAIETLDLPFAIGNILTDEDKTEPKADGVNMIFWKPGFAPRDQFAGKAYPFATECDILLAPKPPFTLLDVQATLMHELGHCMGLSHSTAMSVMTKFQGLPTIGYDDRIALALLYPNHKWELKRRTATITGRVTRRHSPLVGAVLRIIDAKTQRIILSGFSGLVDSQRRVDSSGRFELPGLPEGYAILRIEPMDAFAASDPEGYGAPVDRAPAAFHPLTINLPELDAGDIHDVGTLTVSD